tara:strand:+ start:1196 stop:1327 length:132 start_codon:yes stop_codon:yes gene_type:complete
MKYHPVHASKFSPRTKAQAILDWLLSSLEGVGLSIDYINLSIP